MLIWMTPALLVHRKVFYEFYQETPIFTILSNMTKAQTQLERPPFADSQEMLLFSLVEERRRVWWKPVMSLTLFSASGLHFLIIYQLGEEL